jgi:hypothetical protein
MASLSSWPAITALAALGAYALARTLGFFTPRSQIADLPGPPRASMLTGHMSEIFVTGAHLAGDGPLPGWIESYGRVFRYYGLLSVRDWPPGRFSSFLLPSCPSIPSCSLHPPRPAH